MEFCQVFTLSKTLYTTRYADSWQSGSRHGILATFCKFKIKCVKIKHKRSMCLTIQLLALR